LTTVTQPDWSQKQAARVGREVKRLRELPPKRSAQWVADRTEQLGCPVPRSNIADLEIGRRKHVLLSELIALAAALDVPTALLVVPLGQIDRVEVLPGQEVDTPGAFRWFVGAAGPGRDPVRLFAEHDDLCTTVLAAVGAAAQRRHWAATAESDAQRQHQEVAGKLDEEEAREGERRLRACRMEMACAGLLLPPLPAGLGYLADTDQAPGNPPSSGGSERGRVVQAPW